MMRIGIDLGGTNLRAAVFDDGTTPRWLHKETIGADRRPETIIDKVAAVAERLASDGTGPIPIGVGIAAMLRDRAGHVARSPHLGWRDVAFGALLAKRLGSRFSLGVYNDVNAITWGEHVAGAARGCDHVLAVYVGTGIGGGLIVDGRLVEGATNCAGEIGHVKVRWDEAAAPCQCGSRGCVEAYVGGSYIGKRIAAELPKHKKSRAIQLAGSLEAVTPSHVDEAAAEGDEWALGLWSELGPLLGVALGNALALVNPQRLVLGGGLLSRTPTLYQLVETAALLAAPTPILEAVTIVPAELGDEAGLVGAAALAASGVSIISAATAAA
ncbi:MAG TPA: ROK family protein [Kofleriaceae bacterium]|nr:ROK family protein [Kofleriaceae bacterium]